ncbi:hypothetical protein [Mycobacterium sp. SA01]|uniref:hypothetical protein n=1 Tax=Mycobacterium sp. SA01 TaxID=3238820 RepID=UPI00351AEC44
MATPTFTLTAGDGLSQLVGTERTALAGALLEFTCGLTPGELLAIDDGLDIVDTVRVTLDADGKINGDLGIELLADDPALNLADPLQWRVKISNAKVRGVPKTIAAWSFFAGSDGDSLVLAEVSHVPGQTGTGLGRGLRGYRSGLVKVSDGPSPLYRWQDETGTLWGEARPYTEIFADSADEAVTAAAPAAVTADIESRTPTVEDLGGGHGRINIGGAHGPSFTWPANGWSGITGRPTVLDGTETGAEVRAAIEPGSAFLIGGDSLSAGTLNDDVSVANPTWPETFAGALGVDVVNLAQGGAASANIATRLGALQPLITLSGNKITAGSYPSNVNTVTAISPSDGWHHSVIAAHQLDLFGTIAGVPGILRQDFSSSYTFKFLPFSTLSADVPVSAGTPFICTGDAVYPNDDGSAHRDRTLIVWTGPNNDRSNVAAMIRDISTMRDHLTSAGKKFYLLSMTSDGSDAIAANAALAAEFPQQWIDVRGYLMTGGLADAGITPTSDDTTAIAAGNIPRSFRPLSSVHMTQTAYDVVGRYVAKVIADNAITIAGKPVALGSSISKAEITGLAGTEYADPATDTIFRHAVDVGEATVPREMADANISTGSGLRRYVFFKARKTETITQVRTVCTVAAVSTPNASTLCRIGVWQVDPATGNLINGAVTANTTSLWTAAQAYTTALTTSFSKVRGMWICAATIQIGASTAPQLMGHNGVGASEMGVAPRLSAITGSQTDIGSAAFVTAPTSDTTIRPYIVLLP